MLTSGKGFSKGLIFSQNEGGEVDDTNLEIVKRIINVIIIFGIFLFCLLKNNS